MSSFVSAIKDAVSSVGSGSGDIVIPCFSCYRAIGGI